MKTNRIIKCVAVVICAAVIVSGIAFTKNKSGNHSDTSGNNSGSIETKLANSFTITAMASELIENEPFLLKGIDKYSGAVIQHDWMGREGILNYSLRVPFTCEGNNIESVTYSVSKGTFQLLGNTDNISIIDFVLYEGEEIPGCYWGDDVDLELKEDSEFGMMFPDRTYYTQYTVAYENQINNKIQINIAGSGKVSNVLDIGITRDRETRARVYNEMLDDVYITCTVNYTDGTSESKNIKAVAIPVEEEYEEVIPVYFGFVLE